MDKSRPGEAARMGDSSYESSISQFIQEDGALLYGLLYNNIGGSGLFDVETRDDPPSRSQTMETFLSSSDSSAATKSTWLTDRSGSTTPYLSVEQSSATYGIEPFYSIGDTCTGVPHTCGPTSDSSSSRFTSFDMVTSTPNKDRSGETGRLAPENGSLSMSLTCGYSDSISSLNVQTPPSGFSSGMSLTCGPGSSAISSLAEARPTSSELAAFEEWGNSQDSGFLPSVSQLGRMPGGPQDSRWSSKQSEASLSLPTPPAESPSIRSEALLRLPSPPADSPRPNRSPSAIYSPEPPAPFTYSESESGNTSYVTASGTPSPGPTSGSGFRPVAAAGGSGSGPNLLIPSTRPLASKPYGVTPRRDRHTEGDHGMAQLAAIGHNMLAGAAPRRVQELRPIIRVEQPRPRAVGPNPIVEMVRLLAGLEEEERVPIQAKEAWVRSQIAQGRYKKRFEACKRWKKEVKRGYEDLKTKLKKAIKEKGLTADQKAQLKARCAATEASAARQLANSLDIIKQVQEGLISVRELPGVSAIVEEAPTPSPEKVLRLPGGSDTEDETPAAKKRLREEPAVPPSTAQSTVINVAGPTPLADDGSRETHVALQSVDRLEGLVRELGLIEGKSKINKSDTHLLLTEIAVCRRAIGDLSVQVIRLGQKAWSSAPVTPRPEPRRVRFAEEPEKRPVEANRVAAPARTAPVASPAAKTKATKPAKKPPKAVSPVPTSESEGEMEPAWQPVKARRKKSGPRSFADVVANTSAPQPTGTRTPARQVRPVSEPTKPKNRLVGFDDKRFVVLAPVTGSDITSTAMLREVIVRSLRPALRDVEVLSMKPRMRGPAFILECSNTQHRDRILQFPRMADLKLTASIPSIPGETVIIAGVDSALSKEDLVDELWSRNLGPMGYDRSTLGNLVIPRFALPCPWIRNGKFVRWVVEVPKAMRADLLSRRTVCVEWARLEVRPYTWVSRCNRCLGYGHTSKDCKQTESTCIHCCEVGHNAKDCPWGDRPPRCGPCHKAGNNPNHSTKSPKCPIYLRECRRLYAQ